MKKGMKKLSHSASKRARGAVKGASKAGKRARKATGRKIKRGYQRTKAQAVNVKRQLRKHLKKLYVEQEQDESETASTVSAGATAGNATPHRHVCHRLS